ncbi:MAG: hypothetical protein HC887_10570, partial [Desulfobacteraceae bacterium]|nr:hypothetical protein [Desulfobacteraceae bacterium]
VFVSRVLADTEDVWSKVLPAAGARYVPPKLVIFEGGTQSACGPGQTAMGPFYCPLDQKIYIDLQFYDELRRRFRAPGTDALCRSFCGCQNEPETTAHAAAQY